LAGDIARLRLTRALPLQVGDRVILSDHTRWHLPMGAVVLDVDPVPLRRRGAAIVRADALRSALPVPGVRDQLRWRGAIRCSVAEAWGLPMGDLAGVRQAGDWLVEPATWDRWATQLAGAVDAHASTHSQDPVLPMASAAAALQLPDPDLVAALAAAMGLQLARGGLRRPGRSPGMGAAEPALQEIETALRANPFAAPERGELARLGLTGRDLAVAVAVGRLIRLEADIVLLPDAPARALQILGRLPQPFTTSQARIALGSTRRVVIPLLEHLDRERVTTRVDENRRQVTN
jgi:selenocysteine-specific elongation factor